MSMEEFTEECDTWFIEDHDFDYFVSCFKAWQKFFGATDFSLHFRMVAEAGEGFRAAVSINDISNRTGEIHLCSEWDIEPTRYTLNKTAFHEALELLFADCNIMALSRNFAWDRYDRENHRVIRLLESSVFESMWEKEDVIFDIQSSVEELERKGQAVSCDDSDETVLCGRLRGCKRSCFRWINSISPLQRIAEWWYCIKTD